MVHFLQSLAQGFLAMLAEIHAAKADAWCTIICEPLTVFRPGNFLGLSSITEQHNALGQKKPLRSESERHLVN